MTKKRPTIDDFDDVPPLTREDIRQFRPLHEMVPPEVLAHLPKRKPGQRGPGKKPVKVSMTFRIDRDLAEVIKASGDGYGKRVNDALHFAFEEAAPPFGKFPVRRRAKVSNEPTATRKKAG